MRGVKIRFPEFSEALAVLAVVLVVAVVGPARAMPALDRVMGAVFSVHSADAQDRFLGSAFLWEDGMVAVTNAHVVGTAAEVRLVDDHGRTEIARVIARDPVRDVAVLAVAAGRAGLTVGPAPGLGAEVWALGAPLGIAFTVTAGRVSAQARQVDAAVPLRMVQHDAAVNPGSSGGPLVDSAGRLVGMNSRIADGSRMFIGIAYAITGADLTRIVAGLIEETLAPYPVLGMTARAVDRQIAAALAVPVGAVLVDSVTPGRLAAGLGAGDVILAVDGVVLQTAGDLAFAIEAAQVRGAADLAVWRDGARVLVAMDLTLAEAGLAVRDLAGAQAVRVVSYTLASLGLQVAPDARVAEVTYNSLALLAGVAPGDVLLAVNGQTVTAGAVFDRPVLLRLRGIDGRTRHVMLDPWAKTDGFRPLGGANVLDRDVVVF